MKDWTVRGSHYVLELPAGRELHIDPSSPPRIEGWFHRPGAEPLRVASCSTVAETKAVLTDLASSLLHNNRYVEKE